MMLMFRISTFDETMDDNFKMMLCVDSVNDDNRILLLFVDQLKAVHVQIYYMVHTSRWIG